MQNKKMTRIATAIVGSAALLGGLAACSSDDAQDAANNAKDQAGQVATDATDKAGDAMDGAKDKAGEAADGAKDLSLIHISEPTRLSLVSRIPSSA